jgi:hypothetical protein
MRLDPMKTLAELVNLEEPGWALVSDWISAASRLCEVLPQCEERRGDALVATQVTTRSPMGAIIYESAGLMIDDGWLRILGSGNHPRLNRSLPGWNKGKSNDFLFVADDAVGGFFAVNGGALGQDKGNVYYLAPDTLKWFACKMTYSQFLVWALSPSLDQFYQTLRWPGWQNEVKKLSGDRVFFFYPFLFTVGPELAQRRQKDVPIEEHFGLNYGSN